MYADSYQNDIYFEKKMMYALQIKIFVNLLQEFNLQLVKDIRDYDNIALKSDAERKVLAITS